MDIKELVAESIPFVFALSLQFFGGGVKRFSQRELERVSGVLGRGLSSKVRKHIVYFPVYIHEHLSFLIGILSSTITATTLLLLDSRGVFAVISILWLVIALLWWFLYALSLELLDFEESQYRKWMKRISIVSITVLWALSMDITNYRHIILFSV